MRVDVCEQRWRAADVIFAIVWFSMMRKLARPSMPRAWWRISLFPLVRTLLRRRHVELRALRALADSMCSVTSRCLHPGVILHGERTGWERRVAEGTLCQSYGPRWTRGFVCCPIRSTPQEGPKKHQEGSKRAPRGSLESPTRGPAPKV